MITDDLLLDIEISAANLYTRLALRADTEGKFALSVALARMASEERAQAQKIGPGIKTGRLKGPDRWSHYRKIDETTWQRGSSLGGRSSKVSRYLGPKPEDQPWSEVRPKLGSAELLIAVYYLTFRGDFKTFKEEINHARFNGIRLTHILRGLCLALSGQE